MIVKSATGPVDLSNPENIRAGMVFRVPGYRPYTVCEPIPRAYLARDNGNGRTFLGCDPAVADPTDCERFGTAPSIEAHREREERLGVSGNMFLQEIDAELQKLASVLAAARAPGGDPINLTPQAAALRAALPSIDALPWSAANKRSLRTAAHAVCEMVEATDGKAPAGLRGPVTEMLAALATAAHVGPAVVKDAELARGAAALMMPKRRAK